MNLTSPPPQPIAPAWSA